MTRELALRLCSVKAKCCALVAEATECEHCWYPRWVQTCSGTRECVGDSGKLRVRVCPRRARREYDLVVDVQKRLWRPRAGEDWLPVDADDE